MQDEWPISFNKWIVKKKKKKKPQMKTSNATTNEKENYRLKKDSKDIKPVVTHRFFFFVTHRFYQDPD